jgi:murein DD-endopeptidase MepM/ murein hydrolase activator NlpD
VRGYYDARARAPYEGGWRKPVDAPITSRFNPKRMHPVLHRIMPHTGTDFGAPAGTPVGASAPGVVEFVGSGGPSGNLVTVKHAGGIQTGYAHLSRFADGLKVGDRVKRLQLVGYVGSTGRSTGPHLHFSAKRDGKFFDAETLNLDGLRVLEPSERTHFDKVKLEYDAKLDQIALPPRPPQPARPAEPSASAETDPMTEPNEPAPPPAVAGGTPPSRPGNPIYLTDEELLKLQGQGDGDEVP